MASQRRWNLFLQKTCLCGEIWGGRNQFGCDVAVDIELLAAVPKMQVQNPRTLENKCIAQWFPGNHRQKNLIENFVDPLVSAFGIHCNQWLRSPNLPSFVQLRKFKTGQERNFRNILCHQLASD